MADLQKRFIRDGRLAVRLPTAGKIRERTLRELKGVEL
jgi:hypothetical protein